MKHSVVFRFTISLVLGLLLVGSLFMGGAVGAVTATPRMADLTVTDLVSGGQDVAVTVTLRDKAPKGGVAIRLASSNSALSVSSNLTIPAGAKSATTTATTKAVGTRTKAVVSAIYGGVTKTETVVIRPVALAAISAPATVSHGESAEVTISLTAPAPAGGATVRLVGNRPSVLAVPATVTIPAGSSSAVAVVTAFTHRGDADVTLTAKLSGSANVATVTTVLGTGFPDATATATATNTAEPTMTNTPEPTATNTPEPTMTNTPEPTATNTAEPTATNTPEPTATNTVVPQSLTISVPAGGLDFFTMDVCLQNPTDTPVTVDLAYSASSPMAWVDIWPSTQLTLSSVTSCATVQLHSDNYSETPWIVTLTATLNSVPYTSAPMSFWYF